MDQECGTKVRSAVAGKGNGATAEDSLNQTGLVDTGFPAKVRGGQRELHNQSLLFTETAGVGVDLRFDAEREKKSFDVPGTARRGDEKLPSMGTQIFEG